MNFTGQSEREQLREAIPEFVQSFLDFHENMKSEKVMQLAGGDTIQKLRNKGIPQSGRPLKEVMEEMTQDVYANQILMQHPRWFGFIPSPVSLLSWLGDIMTNAYDTHAASWLQCSGGSCIEQEVIRWMCARASYPENTCGGIFVSGGSMANLTALAAARNNKLAEHEYGKGVAYVSEQTHSSVSKGLRIIGFRADQIRKIPTDSAFRMNMAALEKAVSEDVAAGKLPFVVIATAGTTNTGSIDPLHEIADLCDRFHLWMHVDGAYGASVLASHKYKCRLAGIERSDSISWDAHKWLMQTYSCSAVLVRDKRNLINCFHTHPEYLKDATVEEDQINFWDLGPELTRPARSLKFWLTLQVMGTDAVSNMVEYGFLLAEWAEDEIRKHTDWEIVSPAQQAIVNFRYAPAGWSKEKLDILNQRISQEILSDGYAGILTTELNHKKVLRICAFHPETTEEDMRNTIQRLDDIAHRLMKE